MNMYLLKENIWMANKHVKTLMCFISLIAREIQMKTTLRYHCTPARMAKIKDWQYQVLAKVESN
jgi:hypothetical protein